ncbi:alpha/beta hydrolase, partial [bacterium]|nr:alpha/beta hydrolase [bacterium]
IKAVISFLRKRHPDKPLWLIGTSRGSISAANVASRIQGKAGPDGIVLTSSVTRKSRKNFDSLEDIDLYSITVPTYIVHHEYDDCVVTPYDEAVELMDELSSVKVKEFKGVTGGDTVGNPCKGKSYHGFLDIEDKVVKLIVDWVKTH